MSGVSYKQFLDLCRQRRSVRWFEQRRVPADLVSKALDAAAQAPSACNRQPFLFRYFDDPADAHRIASIAMGTTGYAQNVPAIVVLLGDLGCYPEERDRHVVYIDASLAACSSCWRSKRWASPRARSTGPTSSASSVRWRRPSTCRGTSVR